MNQRVDEEALIGVGGGVVFVVFGSELGEIFGLFVEHDLVNSVDAVLEGVEAGCGFAGGGARAGRSLCVHAVGFGLLGGCHKNLDSRLAGGFAAGRGGGG